MPTFVFVARTHAYGEDAENDSVVVAQTEEGAWEAVRDVCRDYSRELDDADDSGQFAPRYENDEALLTDYAVFVEKLPLLA